MHDFPSPVPRTSAGLCVPDFDIAQPLHIQSLHAAVLGLPDVVGRLGNAKVTTDTPDLHSGLKLLQRRNDLTIGEFDLAHRRTPWV